MGDGRGMDGQVIGMFFFFDAPEGFAAVAGEAVQGADFGEGAEFIFVQMHARFEVFEGDEGSAAAFFEKLESVIGLEALDHAKAETEGVGGLNRGIVERWNR